MVKTIKQMMSKKVKDTMKKKIKEICMSIYQEISYTELNRIHISKVFAFEKTDSNNKSLY